MISVCLATYNGEKYIHRQVVSILNQLGSDDELIISDDGSSDYTISILNSMKDSRIKIFINSRHGVNGNFENALNHANGDYIFLSDQDDVWMPDKVKTCMEYLHIYSCVISDCSVEDTYGNVIYDSFYKANGTRKGKMYNLFVKNGYLGCCMAFRKEVLVKALPFPANIPMHDIWIGNVASFRYNTIFIPQKLIKYCRHGDNASSAAEVSRYSLMEKLNFRWQILKNLL